MDLEKLIPEFKVQLDANVENNTIDAEMAASIKKELDDLLAETDDQKEGLAMVNLGCLIMKVGLNAYWKNGGGKPELDLFIEHKSNSVGRRQTEEIEPGINSMEVRGL